jgi:transposase
MRLTEKFPSQVESFDFLSCIKNECNGRMRIRLLSLQSLKEGNKIKDICSYLKICRDRINIWASKFLEQGIEGLKELPGRGSKSKISLEEKKEVAKFIEEKSQSSQGGRVFADDVVKYIKDNFNQTYTRSAVYSIMHDLNFAWITSRSIHPKCNKEAQEEFKKNLAKSKLCSSQGLGS